MNTKGNMDYNSISIRVSFQFVDFIVILFKFPIFNSSKVAPVSFPQSLNVDKDNKSDFF